MRFETGRNGFVEHCDMCMFPFEEGDKVYFSPYDVKNQCICEECFTGLTNKELTKWLGYDMDEIEDYVTEGQCYET